MNSSNFSCRKKRKLQEKDANEVHFQSIQNKNKKLKKVVKKQKNKINKLEDDLDRLKKINKNLKEENHTKELEKAVCKSEANLMKFFVDMYARKNATLKVLVKYFEENVEAREKEIKKLKQELCAADASKKKMKIKNNELLKQRKELESKIGELNARISDIGVMITNVT